MLYVFFFKFSYNISVPKAAPKVHVDVLSSTKLNVNWQSLTKKEARGVIVEYKIQSKLHALPLKDITVPATFENYIITSKPMIIIIIKF